MIWQYSPYYIPFIACGCITLILAATGWRNRGYVCAKPFALLMLAVSLWAFGSALEVSSADMPTQMFALALQYPGIVTVPVAWLLFALDIPDGSTGSRPRTSCSSLPYPSSVS